MKTADGKPIRIGDEVWIRFGGKRERKDGSLFYAVSQRQVRYFNARETKVRLGFRRPRHLWGARGREEGCWREPQDIFSTREAAVEEERPQE